ncbi:MAG: hypothetical protein NHB32_22445 [Fischerella sp. CENA71]|nr:hypothetical protein [Fischerella sp. CENA71]
MNDEDIKLLKTYGGFYLSTENRHKIFDFCGNNQLCNKLIAHSSSTLKGNEIKIEPYGQSHPQPGDEKFTIMQGDKQR